MKEKNITTTTIEKKKKERKHVPTANEYFRGYYEIEWSSMK